MSDDAPSRALLWTDYGRSLAELGLLAGSWPLIARMPRGDGHPVIVLPGLSASDRSTVLLRSALRRLGYPVYGWGLGRNIGPTRRAVEGMSALLERAHAEHGQAVSLVGWSLGGIFARQLARQRPDLVRQVITLGSPIRLAESGQSHAHAMFQRYSHLHVEKLVLPLEHGLGPLPVPATSVYSRLDGIVSWRACLDQPSARSENVEVLASHFGIGHHPAALWVVADRLAQPLGEWQPFEPPPFLRLGMQHRDMRLKVASL